MPESVVQVRRHARRLRTDSEGFIQGLESIQARAARRAPRPRFGNLPEIFIWRLADIPTELLPDSNREKIGIFINSLYAEASPEDVNIPTNEEIPNPSGRRFYVATSDEHMFLDNLVGVASLEKGKREIHNFYILPYFRRRKYGTAFALKIEEVIKNEWNGEMSQVYVKHNNADAIKFWKKIGYKKITSVSTPTAVLMKKSLVPPQPRTPAARATARRDITKI